MANVWQGIFPQENTTADGFEGRPPVGSYPANGYGLHDMAGNVWEWAPDLYLFDYYKTSPERNPPAARLAASTLTSRASRKHVISGGSFLCSPTIIAAATCPPPATPARPTAALPTSASAPCCG